MHDWLILHISAIQPSWGESKLFKRHNLYIYQLHYTLLKKLILQLHIHVYAINNFSTWLQIQTLGELGCSDICTWVINYCFNVLDISV
jgi:hypothetical protein